MVLKLKDTLGREGRAVEGQGQNGAGHEQEESLPGASELQQKGQDVKETGMGLRMPGTLRPNGRFRMLVTCTRLVIFCQTAVQNHENHMLFPLHLL